MLHQCWVKTQMITLQEITLFLCFRQVLASLEGAVLATFFDLYENVSIVSSSVVCRWCFMMRNKTGLFLRVLVEFQTWDLSPDVHVRFRFCSQHLSMILSPIQTSSSTILKEGWGHFPLNNPYRMSFPGFPRLENRLPRPALNLIK